MALLEVTDGHLQGKIEHLGELRLEEETSALGLGHRGEALPQGNHPLSLGA